MVDLKHTISTYKWSTMNFPNCFSAHGTEMKTKLVSGVSSKTKIQWWSSFAAQKSKQFIDIKKATAFHSSSWTPATVTWSPGSWLPQAVERGALAFWISSLLLVHVRFVSLLLHDHVDDQESKPVIQTSELALSGIIIIYLRFFQITVLLGEKQS